MYSDKGKIDNYEIKDNGHVVVWYKIDTSDGQSGTAL